MTSRWIARFLTALSNGLSRLSDWYAAGITQESPNRGDATVFIIAALITATWWLR